MEGAPVIGLADAQRIPNTPRHNPCPAEETATLPTHAVSSTSTTATPSCERRLDIGTLTSEGQSQSTEGQWNLSKRGERAHDIHPLLEASHTHPSAEPLCPKLWQQSEFLGVLRARDFYPTLPCWTRPCGSTGKSVAKRERAASSSGLSPATIVPVD